MTGHDNGNDGKGFLHGSTLLQNRSKSQDTENNVSETRLGREISVTENSDIDSLLPSQSQTKIRKCVTCGKPFKSRSKFQTHCEDHLVKKTEKRKHPNCLWCGKKLWKGEPNAFCSNDCRREYRLKQYCERRIQE